MQFFRRAVAPLLLAGAMALSAGCDKGGGNNNKDFDAAPPGMVSDGGVTAAPPSTDVVSGSGKLRGGNVEMDIQIGHPTTQKKTSGGNTTVEGNSAIKR
jgi:hypothetical protein